MEHFLYAGSCFVGKGKPVGVINSDGLVYRGGTSLLGEKKLIGKSRNGIVYRENGGFFSSYTEIGSYMSGVIYQLKTPGGWEKIEVGRYENGIVYQVTGGWGSKKEIGQYDGDPAGAAALLLLYDLLV